MNKKRKGDRIENRAKKELETKGYEVERKIKLRWGAKDFWNRFDLVAVSKDRIRFVQLTNNANKPLKVRKHISKFQCPNSVCSKEIWIWYDYEDWRKYRWFETREEWMEFKEE